MENQPQSACCRVSEPGTTRSPHQDKGSRLRRSMGWLIVAFSCAFACVAATISALLWPIVALTGWFGAYQVVYAANCGFSDDAVAGEPIERLQLSAQARVTRRRMGVRFLLASLLPAAFAFQGWAIFWPLAFLAWWFGASFLTAAATGYPGCPEVGAIPSLFLRRPIRTRCAPMERIDFRRDQGS